MRSTTGQQIRALQAPSHAPFVRAKVEDADGTMRDLSDLFGVDWLEGVSWSADVDQVVASMELHLKREVFDLSLSPVHETSRLNLDSGGAFGALLQESRRIDLYVATLPEGHPRPSDASSEWVHVFKGIIDQVEFANETVVVTAGDLGRRLQQVVVEGTYNSGDNTVDPPTYGSGSAPPDAGDAFWTVIQDILDDANTDWGLPEAVTLYSPTGTGATPINTSDYSAVPTLYEFQPRPDLVMALIQQIVDTRGWTCRYEWHPNTSDWQLVLREPDRSPGATVVNLDLEPSFGSSDLPFTDWRQAAYDRASIRNVVRIYFELNDGSTTENDGAAPVKAVQVEDSTSKTENGRRFCSFNERIADGIDTIAEATTMANAILDDLKEPNIDGVLVDDHALLWMLEIQDYVRVQPDGFRFTSATDLAVLGYIYSLRSTGGGLEVRTELVMRGRPASKLQSWLEAEAREGVATPKDQSDPKGTEPTATASPGGITVTMPRPARSADEVDHYEVHFDTEAGFTPGSDTLKETFKGGEVRVVDLPPRIAGRVKIVSVSKNGRRKVVEWT